MLEGWTAVVRSAKCSPIVNQKGVQRELVTTSAKLQVAKGALTAALDHFKRHSSTLCVAEAAVQERIKSNLLNYIWAVLYEIEQTTEECQLNVDGDV